MSCHGGGTQEWPVGPVSSDDRLKVAQAVCGYPGDGRRWPLMSFPSDKAGGGAGVALKAPDKEGDASTLKVVR